MKKKKALIPNDFEPEYEKLSYFLYIFQKFESYNNYMAVISVSGRHRAEYTEHQLTFDWCNETFQCTLGAAEMQLQLIGCSLRKVEPKTFSTELRTKLREREERSASPSATTKPHSASNYYTYQYLVVQHILTRNFFLFHQSPKVAAVVLIPDFFFAQSMMMPWLSG